MSTISFEISIGDPVNTHEHFDDVAVDPARELTEVERAITQFCVDNNREVAIRIGTFEERVWLFPDLVSSLRRMPELVAAFERDEPLQLGFPDHAFDIECRPRGVLAECVISRYGAAQSSETFVCQRRDVAAALRGFARTLAREAVEHGYLEAANADVP